MGNPAGDQLRSSRVAKGEPLDQIARKLHIRLHYLEALEAGEFESLPSRVQARGFLRIYAAYLGLDAPAILDLWEGKELAQPSAPEPKAQSSEPVPLTELSTAEFSPESIEVEPPDEEAEIKPSPEPPSTKSAMRMAEIGAALHQQREKLGFNLEEVERNTRVRMRYLIALEEGRLDDLPSPVQGRGMLSSYASFLGLDVDDLLNTFAEVLQSRRVEKYEPESHETLTKGRKTRRKPAKTATWRRIITPDMVLGAGIILALLVFALWSASQVSALQGRQQAPTPVSISDVLMKTPTAVVFTSPTTTGAARLDTRAPEGNQPAGTSAPLGTITMQAGISGPVQVVVVARARTYMKVIVDGKTAFDGRVTPGNAYPFGGDRRIEMVVGSAAALQVFYNQNDLGSLGLVGQVRSLVFTREGLLTPTAQFTPTSTRTSLPSATLRPSPTQPTATITPFIP